MMAFRHLSLLILLSASARGKTRFYDNTKWAGDSLAGGSCMTSKGGCMFPFEYKGKKINGCIPKNGWAWCATKKDRVGDWWAVCPKECKLHVGRATHVPCTGRYEYDVEYSQYDIRSCGENKKPTASACQEFCQSVPGCVGWEWGYAGDNCCAKSHMSNRKSGKLGRVAGRVNACPPGCEQKDNALTDLASIAVMKSNGFKFDFTAPNADNNFVGQQCVANGEKAKWFGWSGGNNAVGTLSATFTGYGEVTVDFGNCWDDGNVKLYLDSKLISTAPVGTKSIKTTFVFTPRSVLKLKDENGNAVVMLNSISVKCSDLKPTVESSADYSHEFRGSRLLDADCEGKNPSNYWLSPDFKTGERAYIIINLGKVTQFNRFKIKNTHNGDSNDRGARKVRLYTSNSKNGPWKLKADKKITWARNKGCNVPLEEVTIATTDAQFIKLVIVSFYGWGGGLKYLGVDLVPGCDDKALTDLASIAVMKSNGWKFDFTDPDGTVDGVGQKCVANGQRTKWFGWSGGNAVGTLSATFTGFGEVTVDFGNCWTAGNVKLYLDSKLISTAPFGTKSQKATFAYTPGSVLKLKDENGNAVVMLNSISVNCNGKEDVAPATAHTTSNKEDCSCNDFINVHKFGQCKNPFGVAPACYVNLPSTCTDLKESSTNPGKFHSYIACKPKPG